MSAYIINFQSPKELDDLRDRYESDGLTNIDHILNFEDTLKEWTIDRNAQVNDVLFFMCAKTSKDHMAHVCAEARREEEPGEIIQFAKEKLALYKKYAGHIVAVGRVEEPPFQTEDAGYEYPAWRSTWYAKIKDFRLLSAPVSIDMFRSFITVSRTGSITRLSEDQEVQLKDIIHETNPDIDFSFV